MKALFMIATAIIFVLVSLIVSMSIRDTKKITSQRFETENLKKENKQLSDSLYFIGYNFKENPNTMDSLHFIGYMECFRDAKEKAGFHGW